MDRYAVRTWGIVGILGCAVVVAAPPGPVFDTTNATTRLPTHPPLIRSGGFAVPLIVGGLCLMLLGMACILEVLRRLGRELASSCPPRGPICPIIFRLSDLPPPHHPDCVSGARGTEAMERSVI
ncbi:envelope glycoprotein J [Chimpanzee herpesvirus strain 105640]|uniref:Glycoprotein J n=1 Tax=Chimpanzee herpesvirus strain 105640 TaxID=332937 RepID=Q3C1Y3_9ALPH|nr:envelope glycoprotein J [Chimpanzee herpesvirus strain 105640]AFV26954.1 envelope glycoprotein J [Chimpanzee herpesvirus strain 105640]BAE47059.1 glycoprotein J [Chimpanzee herpesvirus strain 105640]